jgi:hypothetical protein
MTLDKLTRAALELPDDERRSLAGGRPRCDCNQPTCRNCKPRLKNRPQAR